MIFLVWEAVICCCIVGFEFGADFEVEFGPGFAPGFAPGFGPEFSPQIGFVLAAVGGSGALRFLVEDVEDFIDKLGEGKDG